LESEVTPARQPVFESGERAGAVTIKAAVSSVVEAENVTGSWSGKICSVVRNLPGAIGDRLHAPDEPLRRFLHPIAGNERPHRDTQIRFASSRRKPRVAHAEGRSKPMWGSPAGRANGIVTPTELIANLRWAEPEKIRMRVGVIAERVAASQGFSHQVRALANKTPDQKKCRARLVAVEQIQELWGDRRIWAVIEGDTKFAR